MCFQLLPFLTYLRGTTLYRHNRSMTFQLSIEHVVIIEEQVNNG